MKLFGLADLHVNHKPNRETLEAMPAHPQDWLILAGDLGETEAQLRWTFETLTPKWAKVLWVPGNHELWTPPSEGDAGLRGEARYLRHVAVCREYSVLTPEDPYPRWPGEGPERYVCPLFLLYDYSYAPPGMTPTEAVAWAAADGIVAMDERLLHPAPHGSRAAWCAYRVDRTAQRLTELPSESRTILINHWPLRADLVRLFRIPRYAPWCGTKLTEDWHRRFNAEVVVSGHLHMRATDYRDGTRFEEVSLGYPRHWKDQTGAAGYLRQILPETAPTPAGGTAGPDWHRAP
ncbi:MAG: metallophosphoesterase [Rhodobacterales bacterium]|nr:metallophosphoesterase [Rhodobacterales bacterium]